MSDQPFSPENTLPRELSQTSDASSSDHTLLRVASALSHLPSSSSPKRRSPYQPSPDDHPLIRSVLEAQKRPRGRPRGSSNKNKSPMLVPEDGQSSMKTAILEISPGSDIINSVINFACRNDVGITIMSATGSVSFVKLRQQISQGPSLDLHGTFNLFALSGSFLGSLAPKELSADSSSFYSSACFGISLAGSQGQVFGGIVAGKVIAASIVVITATTFRNPTFHKLPSDTDEAVEKESSACVPENEYCTTTGGICSSVYGVGDVDTAPIDWEMSPDSMFWGPPF